MAAGNGMLLAGTFALVLAVNACGGRDKESPAANGSTAGGASGAPPIAGSAGSPVGGGATGGSSAGGWGGAVQAGSAGASANGGAAGDSSGEGGDTIMPPGPPPCSSSDGVGCAEDEYCADIADDCAPNVSDGCEGYCAGRLGTPQCGPDRPCPEGYTCVPDHDLGGDICIDEARACTSTDDCPAGFVCLPDGGCVPDRVDCSGTVLCPANPGPCPAGFLRSVIDECWGACVPIDRCECGSGWLCESVGAECDRRDGRCAVAVAPEPRCGLPFEPGPCDAAVDVYAFVDGSCRAESYGGCEGNENRFFTLEECLLRCEGLGRQHDCPADRTPRPMCLECGVAGGCTQSAMVCAKPCERDEDCDGFVGCVDSYCTASGCR